VGEDLSRDAVAVHSIHLKLAHRIPLQMVKAGKLQAGLMPSKKKAEEAQQESLYRRYLREYDLGILSRDILAKLSDKRRQEYWNQRYAQKYRRRIVWSRDGYHVCEHCLCSAYFESGYVSDWQVRFLVGMAPDCAELAYNWPAAAAEVFAINGVAQQ
jgi:hypothetical protein